MNAAKIWAAEAVTRILVVDLTAVRPACRTSRIVRRSADFYSASSPCPFPCPSVISVVMNLRFGCDVAGQCLRADREVFEPDIDRVVGDPGFGCRANQREILRPKLDCA
jgi:hypothetical protein